MQLNERIADLRARCKSDEAYGRFVTAQVKSFHKNVTVPGIIQPQDITEWWHNTGRAKIAAALYALTNDEYIGVWLRDAALWIARQSADAWIGPFFRARTNPLKGTLETAHLANAIAAALLYTPALFTESEREEMRCALREKALPPLEEWLKPFDAGTNSSRNNWCIVELDGVFACAAALDREELVRKYIPLFEDLHKDYNSEFYGEPAGYWSYACTNFLNTRFLCDMVFPALAEEMPDVNIVLRPFIWSYYRRQGTFLLQNLEETRERWMTFGDQSTEGGFNSLILLYISIYGDDPQIRALAAYHLEKIFSRAAEAAPLPCYASFHTAERRRATKNSCRLQSSLPTAL